jgi:2-iminobutanoate/2-iminopropanoate deaminase
VCSGKAMKLSLLSFILIFPFFCSSQTEKRVVFADKAPAPIGPYSQGVKAGATLYVSGQIALRSDGSLDSSSIENETTQVLNNIKAILEAAKMNMKQIAKSTIYVTDLKNFKRINDIYAAWFPENPPARETVEVRALPKGAHVEISVIATQ